MRQMAGNQQRRGARTTNKKGATVGSGGQRRKQLKGRGPTPKAAERVGHLRVALKPLDLPLHDLQGLHLQGMRVLERRDVDRARVQGHACVSSRLRVGRGRPSGRKDSGASGQVSRSAARATR